MARAAITRAVDIARERHGEALEAAAQRRTDLDETRRLAYSALMVGTAPGNPILAATIVNALAHHGMAADPKDAAAHVATVVNGAVGSNSESERWLRARIDEITARLGA